MSIQWALVEFPDTAADQLCVVYCPEFGEFPPQITPQSPQHAQLRRMCERYYLQPPLALSAAARRAFEAWPGLLEQLQTKDAQYNIGLNQSAPVIALLEGVPSLLPMSWGFVPQWSADGRATDRSINAHTDTLTTSRVFSPALRHRRCLVPASGYYEWSGTRRDLRPFNVTAADGQGLFFAGVWSSWRDSTLPGASVRFSFAMITGRVAVVSGPPKDGQPIALPPELWAQWVSDDQIDVTGVLESVPQRDFTYYQVSTAVNDPRRRGVALIQPLSGR